MGPEEEKYQIELDTADYHSNWEPLIAERDRLRAERDAARDEAAGLREALNECRLRFDWIRQNSDPPRLGESMRSVWSACVTAHKRVETALSRTPDQHRDRIVAAGLREVSRLVDDCSRETILREAERLEKEAGNGIHG